MTDTIDYDVTVCAACLTACCWHGEHMCQAAETASTAIMRASELRKLNRENASYYTRDRIEMITGVRP